MQIDKILWVFEIKGETKWYIHVVKKKYDWVVTKVLNPVPARVPVFLWYGTVTGTVSD